ncbi:MAG: hypothetical protein Tp1125DCM00d2C21254131_5 [Prokaryotic dsDNA virus sp.]|nr:MAG: hypothetical protein Tp1125DCM00d2C21254131_5 [Prokaryotic dsDNA virus sp.]|tara:strand:- start:5192 stop:5443 length:252 start_codon:yes stop_codon:yes gene_type:complete
MTTKVWVLTEEYNEYDQHGEYFVAVFAGKPSLKKLAEHFKMTDESAHYSDPMGAVDFLLHLQQGGGRQGTDDHWYNLEEVECK